jgi:hypothetical protein
MERLDWIWKRPRQAVVSGGVTPAMNLLYIPDHTRPEARMRQLTRLRASHRSRWGIDVGWDEPAAGDGPPLHFQEIHERGALCHAIWPSLHSS